MADLPAPSTMKIDWGDGVSAIDRTQRAIVMATDAAIQRLMRLGHRRGDIEIFQEDPEDELVLLRLTLNGAEVYRVMFVADPRGPLGLIGQWVRPVSARGWRRLLFWRK